MPPGVRAVRLGGAPGAKRSYAFKPKEHVELGEGLKFMDFETAAKLSGARFVVLKKGLARLERAIGQFMLDLHTTEHGYIFPNARYVMARREYEHWDALHAAGDRSMHAIAFGDSVAPVVRAERAVLVDDGHEIEPGVQVTLLSTIPDEPRSDLDVEALHEALERLAEVSPELALLVERRYFGGMTVEEIALLDGSSTATVKRRWRAARAWLHDALQP